MAKFFGVIGFSDTVETSPGVWEEKLIEKEYFGDITRNTRRWENGEHLNDTLTINNTISVLLDSYIRDRFFAIRYVKWMGSCWKVTNVEIARPRLILTIGGLYNGDTTGASELT